MADPAALADPADFAELPFFLPPNLSLEFPVPKELRSRANTQLSRGYAEMANRINAAFERLNKEPKSNDPQYHRVSTRDDIQKIIAARERATEFAAEMVMRGSPPFTIPADVAAAVDLLAAYIDA